MGLFHKHCWKEVDRQYLLRDNRFNYFSGSTNTQALPTPVTVITQRCERCLKYRQQTLTGHIGKEKQNA